MLKFLKERPDIFYISLLFVISIPVFCWGGYLYYHPDSLITYAELTRKNNFIPVTFLKPHFVEYLYLLFIRLQYFFYDNLSYDEYVKAIHRKKLPVDITYFVNYFFAISSVILTYFTSLKLLRSGYYSFVSAVILLTSIIWVADAHFPIMDIASASFGLLIFLVSIIFYEENSSLDKKQKLILGVIIGIGTACKYPAAFAAICIPVIFYRPDEKEKLWKDIKQIVFISITTFIILEPFIIVRFANLISDIFEQIRINIYGFKGLNFDNRPAIIKHLFYNLPNGVGIITYLLGICGAYFFVKTPGIEKRIRYGFFSVIIIYLIIFGSSVMPTRRYILQVIPLFCILSGAGIKFLCEKFQDSYKKIFINALILCPILFHNFTLIFQYDRLLHRVDLRDRLPEILSEQVKDKNIFSTPYVAAPLYNGFDIELKNINDLVSNDGQEFDVKKNLTKNDLMIIDEFSADRFIEYGYLKNYLAPLRKKFINYENMYVVQINPYKVSKRKAGLIDNFDPYLPQLELRNNQSPYIEIYGSDKAIISTIYLKCKEILQGCSIARGSDSYFLKEITEKGESDTKTMN